jgi:small-conductance mechanosensitive channel
MGGVRGDVIALTFTQTTIMEMGQPPPVQNADPAMWVRSRQYTGRVVTVSNAKIFDEPVFNYSRDFPFLFEELTLPVGYAADRAKAESILLGVAERHTVKEAEIGQQALDEMRRRYFIQGSTTEPKVYWRLTDNWLELTVRFVTREHGVRDVKDKMSREILAALDQAGIGLASTTFEIVGLPPVRVAVENSENRVG